MDSDTDSNTGWDMDTDRDIGREMDTDRNTGCDMDTDKDTGRVGTQTEVGGQGHRYGQEKEPQ